MGSGKENLKKSLGITEYPWSSDDDDDDLQPAKDTNSRPQPRASVDDMPGTSGTNGGQPSLEEASPATARRIQTDADRSFFWSIINHSPITPPENPIPRRKPEDVMPVKRIANKPSDEILSSVEARRLIEFKNLTRSLQNLEQSLSTANTAQPTASHSVPRVSTGITPPLSGTVTTTSSSARTVTATSQSGHNSSRFAASTSHAAPPFTRVLTSTSHTAHPYSRPVASTSHAAPTHSKASNTGHGTQVHSRNTVSGGRPSNLRFTNSVNRSVTSSSWAAASNSYAPSSSWNSASTSHVNSSSSWNTDSGNGPYASWGLPYTSHANTPQNPTPAPPLHPIVTGPNGGVRWRRCLPPFPPPNDMQNGVLIYNNEDNNNENSGVDNSADLPANISATDNAEYVAVVDLSTNNVTSNTAAEPVVEAATANEHTEDSLVPPGTEGDELIDSSTSENVTNSAGLINAAPNTDNADANTESTPSGASYQGLKRKRDSIDDRREPFTVKHFNLRLLRLLECPVCLEWMEPPISQCRRGHLVCCRCRTRLNACPVCRTPFSSVRNRAMEGVAEMLRYPCRHGCGREVRLRKRAPHESSCDSRRYQCPAPDCMRHPPLLRDELAHHFQCKHLPILKIGCKHKFSIKVNAEQHDTWLIMAFDDYFHLRVDVDIRTWGVVVYVSYIGPKKNADYYFYEVTVQGQHNSRRLIYTRTTHSDLESSSVNVSRQDCFHLTLDQALNFLRVKNRHCEPDKFLDFDVELIKSDFVDDSRSDSD